MSKVIRALIRALGLLMLVGFSAATIAAEDTSKSANSPADPRVAIAQKFPGLKPDDVRSSPLPGMFEVSLGADTVYVSADGRYLISGDMYEVDTRTNLTEAGRTQERRKALAKLDERDMIIFAPVKAKHTITVFTDVDCGYCRKLHGEIEELNKLGVRVRYMAYPRAGPDTEDWRKMEAVWCSKDRKAAITQAKQGQNVKSADCGANPVAKQYQLGETMGVRGTPAIFSASGDYIGGYVPPSQLAEKLSTLEKTAQSQ